MISSKTSWLVPKFLKPLSEEKRIEFTIDFSNSMQIDGESPWHRVMNKFDQIEMPNFRKLMTRSAATVEHISTRSSLSMAPQHERRQMEQVHSQSGEHFSTG